MLVVGIVGRVNKSIIMREAFLLLFASSVAVGIGVRHFEIRGHSVIRLKKSQ